MSPALLVSIMGLLTVVAIYYWWARKLGPEAARQQSAKPV
jgi:hypothetical protein